MLFAFSPDYESQTMKRNLYPLITALGLSLLLPAVAQDAGKPTAQLLSDAYTGKAYSPYAKRNFPERPLMPDYSVTVYHRPRLIGLHVAKRL
jgi:hypothetical protein